MNITLKECLQGLETMAIPPYKETTPWVMFTEKLWLLARKFNLCEFTDEELKTAPSRNNLIKRGHLASIHEEVDMYIDPKAPLVEG
jgi:hypothetical protein